MKTVLYEIIEIENGNRLFISIDAKYEQLISSTIREISGIIILEERLQSRYNEDCNFNPSKDYCRMGFLYQVVLIGKKELLCSIKNEIHERINNRKFLEKCYKL